MQSFFQPVSRETNLSTTSIEMYTEDISNNTIIKEEIPTHRPTFYNKLWMGIKENNIELVTRMLDYQKMCQVQKALKKKSGHYDNSGYADGDGEFHVFSSTTIGKSHTFITASGDRGVGEIPTDPWIATRRNEITTSSIDSMHLNQYSRVKRKEIFTNNSNNEGINMNVLLEQYENEQCPLHVACEFSSTAMVEKILNYYNVDTIDIISGKTPLQVAIESGQTQNALKLCSCGANPNFLSSAEDSPLTLAIRFGSEYLIENLLFHYKANPNIECRSITSTPIYECCKRRNPIILDILRKAGCNIDYACGPLRMTVLHQLILENDVEGCMMLLEKKKYRANILLEDANGFSAIHHAVSNEERPNMITLLCKYGSDVNLLTVKAGREVSPLALAILSGLYNNVKVLISLKADINLFMQDKLHGNRITALTFAVKTGNEDIVSLLLKHKPNLEVPTNCTPLFLACKKGFYNVARQLLDEGARTEVTDYHSITPLMIASQKGHYKIVKLLLKRRCIVNQLSKDKETALHIAAREGHIRILKLLLQFGADSSIRNEKRQTALHISCESKRSEIVELLLRHNARVRQKISKTEFAENCRRTKRLQGMVDNLVSPTNKESRTHATKKINDTDRFHLPIITSPNR